MIARGEVRVNGKVVTDLPVFINQRTDQVVVNGRKIELGGARGRGRSESRRVYIAVNKPDRTLATTKDDPHGADATDAGGPRGARRTVMDLVADKDLGRLFPVGRLGFHDTGLVLLTNDGEIANRLTHARYGVPRTYVVIVRGRVPGDVLARLRSRLSASLGPDHPRAADAVRVLSEEGAETELEVTLRESPRLRIDALVFDAGLKVKRLIRTAIGPVSIRGIPSGNWRFLSRTELDDLMQAAGLAQQSDATAGRDTRGGKHASGRDRRGPGTGARGSRGKPSPKAHAVKPPRRILPARKADQRNEVQR